MANNISSAAFIPAGTFIPLWSEIQNGAAINISGNAKVHLGDNHAYDSSVLKSQNQESFLTRLSFPQMYLRRQHISDAFPSTYEWILQPSSSKCLPWDCFVTWLSQPQQGSGVYWIHGKPGSGKSTVMKFLDAKIDHIVPTTQWANNLPILRAWYFFWSGGHPLQQSLEGFCRSILFQILQQRPEMLGATMSACPQVSLKHTDTSWSTIHLRKVLINLLQQLGDKLKLLLLIDGLDECGANEQGELVDFLTALSHFGNIKIVVSSRPENIFKDTFFQCPQLQLEHLTRADIELYVESKFRNQRRWLLLEQINPTKTTIMVKDIIDHAEGVFLWVVLVVRDILELLRDGDGLEQIQWKLSQIPRDLDEYFLRIVESIKPDHRREASVLLQLALHNEDRFASLLSLHLVDTLFLEQPCDTFVLRPGFDLDYISFSDILLMRAKLESAIRKINSRCKGLLQCVDDTNDILFGVDLRSRIRNHLLLFQGHETQYSKGKVYVHIEDLENMLTTSVQFLHRSLRDFLLLPQCQAILISYTGGQSIDTRRHLCSARLLQLRSLAQIGYAGDLAFGLASNILSVLSVNGRSHDSEMMFLLAQETIEWLNQQPLPWEDLSAYWYICECLESWQCEKSNFLSLAIDFQLTSYVVNNMTTSTIRSKKGRPILDYILRPRFFYNEASPGYKAVDPELVKLALASGSDPNERFDDNMMSVWANYLCFLADSICLTVENNRHVAYLEQIANVQALSALIGAGAAPLLPFRWLSRGESTYPQRLFLQDLAGTHPTSEVAIFERRWQLSLPVSTEQTDQGHDVLVPVRILLPNLFQHCNVDVSALVLELRNKETGQYHPSNK